MGSGETDRSIEFCDTLEGDNEETIELPIEEVNIVEDDTESEAMEEAIEGVSDEEATALGEDFKSTRRCGCC